MFNLDKKFASVKLVADVIKTLGKAFDVLSQNVLQNNKLNSAVFSILLCYGEVLL